MAKKRQTKYAKAITEAKKQLTPEHRARIIGRREENADARKLVKERGTGHFSPKNNAPIWVQTEEAREARRNIGRRRDARIHWNLELNGMARVTKDTTCGDMAGMSSLVTAGTFVIVLTEPRASDNYCQVLVNGMPTWISAGRLRKI